MQAIFIKKGRRETCLCVYHLRFEFMIEGLRRYFEKHGDSGGDGDGGAGEMSDGDGSSDDEEGNLTVKELLKQPGTARAAFVCAKDANGYYKQECLSGSCASCGDFKLIGSRLEGTGLLPSGALPSTFMPPRDTSTAEDSAPTLNGKGLLTRNREGKRPDPMEFKMHADHANRMHQYEKDFGDRSEFSLACVLDGNCGVDFNTQIPEDGFGGSPESSLSSPAFGAKENFRQSQRWTQQVTTDGAPTTRSQDPRSSFTGR